MDADEYFTSRPDDPLALLVRQDIDPLSLDELNARVTILQREIERARARIRFTTSHRASADALFKQG